MTKNRKGLLAENAFIHHCLKRGWGVLSPLSNITAYDFVIEKDGVLKRVQVKAAWGRGQNRVVSVRRPRNKAYKAGDYDYLFAVDLDKKENFMVPWSKIKNIRSAISLTKKEWRKWKVSK